MDKQDQILEKLNKLDRIETFLQKNMVTKEEFSELSARVDKLEATVGRLVDAVENLATAVNKITDEHTVLKHQMLTMQEWMHKAGEKIGIEFKL